MLCHNICVPSDELTSVAMCCWLFSEQHVEFLAFFVMQQFLLLSFVSWHLEISLAKSKLVAVMPKTIRGLDHHPVLKAVQRTSTNGLGVFTEAILIYISCSCI